MAHAKILIVEDEGLIANDIASTLENCGHQVTGIAASGEEAIALLKSSIPDLILMDIRLKGDADGIDVALRMRLEEDIPVVFITSHADTDTLTRAKQAEPYGYLTKPFLSPTLSSTVEMALHKHGQVQTLAQREAWLATCIHATATPTLVTDTEGRILMLSDSAEDLLGCSLAQVAGTTWTTAVPLVHADTGVALADLLPQALSRAETCPEICLLPRDTVLSRIGGVDIAVEGEIAPRRTRGQISGAVITLRDITKRTEEERFHRQEQKIQAMGQLAHGVAREFDEHLADIKKQGERLEEIALSSGELEHVRALLDSTESAGNITKRLLVLNSNLVQYAGSVEVNAAIERMVAMELPEEDSLITVSMDLAPKAGTIAMECRDFDKVLLILLVNAYQSMPDGGVVTVSTGVAGPPAAHTSQVDARPFVRIKISDTGTGLSREAQDHLFEPYFTTKEPGQGAGLGLSIAHGIVASVGGSIVVTSTPGLGASFELYLPAMDHLPSVARLDRQPLDRITPLTSG